MSALISAGSRPPRLAARVTLLAIVGLGLIPAQTLAADLICRGDMKAADLVFSVRFTRDAGFTGPVEFRRRETGARVVESSPLRFDRTNAQGQRIYRGHVGGMADVVLVDLAEKQPRAGSEVSVGYDGRWGRGVCALP